jgi:hypothetical protein
MATLVNSANLTRLILLFIGTALVLIGFYGVIEDFIHNWRIEEYSSLAALLSGAAILLATTLVYVIIPDYQSRQRNGLLKDYYIGKPKGEIKEIQHNILERSQGIVAGAEILADYVSTCIREDVSHEDCKKKVLEARKMLVLVNSESNRLHEFLLQLEEYLGSKSLNKQSTTLSKDKTENTK